VEVARDVATPVERQVTGLDGMRYFTSRCADDGRYTLAVTFERGRSPNKALASVRERVERCRADLKEPIRRQGVSVTAKRTGMPVLVILSSPNARFDAQYLSNYARLQTREELTGVPGVGEVLLLGGSEDSVSVRLDQAKLAAHSLTFADVGRTVREQNGRIVPGHKGEFQVIWGKPRPLAKMEQFARVILKTDTEGRVVFLRDVAAVSLAAFWRGQASFNRKPAIVLAVYPTAAVRPRELSAAVAATLARRKETLPEGIHEAVGFDLNGQAPECLMLDVILPDTAGQERTLKALRRCEELVRPFAGDVLALTEPPFPGAASRPNRGYLLVRLASAGTGKDTREQAKQALRKEIRTELPESVVWFRDVSGKGRAPRWNHPLMLAVHGPELTSVRTLTDELVSRLNKSEKVTDTFAVRGLTPTLQTDVDHTKLRQLGLQVQDVFDTLQVALAAHDAARTRKMDALGGAQVRAGNGQLVPLRAFVSFRHGQSGALERFNGRPMARAAANPAPGVSLAVARSLIESLFEAARRERQLSAEYRLTWLEE
jgi:multidrug efflux pump subunit AcrB